MKRGFAVSIGFACALAPEFASAKLACYPLGQIERALGSEYGEMHRFTGKEDAGVEYRLYVNAKTGTWSWIGIAKGTEVGCLIFAGRNEGAAAIPPPGRSSAPFRANF